MNLPQQPMIYQWDYDARFLQDENSTQIPADGALTTASPVPAASPATATIFPTFNSNNGSPSAVSVESPTSATPGGGAGEDNFVPTFPSNVDTAPSVSASPSSDWTLPPNPTSWETETPGWAPTPTSSTSNSSGNKPSNTTPSSQNQYVAFLVIVIVAIVAVLCGWKFCKVWKERRERHQLRLQSTRVDAVLGDMQMVSTDDDEYGDDDPELL